MADDRFDPLDETALDREVRQMLSAEPSPDFVARVRMRIASEPAPAAWRLRWWPLAVGSAAAAAIVLAAVLVIPRSAGVDVASESHVRAGDILLVAPAPAPPPSLAVSALPASADAPPVPARPGAPGIDRGPASIEPVVLVSAAEAEAFRVLVAAARGGEFEVAKLPEPPSARVALPAPADILAPPVEIAAIAPIAPIGN